MNFTNDKLGGEVDREVSERAWLSFLERNEPIDPAILINAKLGFVNSLTNYLREKNTEDWVSFSVDRGGFHENNEDDEIRKARIEKYEIALNCEKKRKITKEDFSSQLMWLDVWNKMLPAYEFLNTVYDLHPEIRSDYVTFYVKE